MSSVLSVEVIKTVCFQDFFLLGILMTLRVKQLSPADSKQEDVKLLDKARLI